MSETRNNFRIKLSFAIESAVKHGHYDEIDADYILNVAPYSEQKIAYEGLMQRMAENER